MSWRLVSTVMIAIFAILLLMTMTAQPIHTATDAIVEIDDGEGGQFDTAQQAESSIRGYFNAMLILILGLVGWGAFYLLRRELTAGRL